MVSIDPESRKYKGGITIPTKCFIPLALLFVVLTVEHVKTVWIQWRDSAVHHGTTTYQESKPVLRNPTHTQDECKLFLAESAMAPNAGLGVFAGYGGYISVPLRLA